jgi:putative addiction module killer protein
MVEIRKTELFAKWLDDLHDIRARARILVRIERLAAGNPGDVKPVGEGVSELRIDYGPGYRVYYKQQGEKVVILLAGGDKRTLAKDIKTAFCSQSLGIYHAQNRYHSLRCCRTPSDTGENGCVFGSLSR